MADNPATMNPFDLDKWSAEARTIAIHEQFKGDEIDAFRHTYVNAMVTWTYGTAAGIAYADGFGLVYEASGLAWTLVHDAAAAVLDPFGVEITPYGIGDQVRSSVMDIYNNNMGVAIGSTATSKEDIISKVANAVRSGLVITSPDPLPNPPSQGSNFVEGEWDWQKQAGGADDISKLLPTLARNIGKKKAPTQQILLTSAAALASALIKSRQREQEDVILNLLTGKSRDEIFEMERNRGGTGGIFDQSGKMSFPALFTNLAESIVGGALGRLFNRSKTTVQESERSREYARNWNLSRSQQAAELARMVQAGTRNL